MFFFNCFGGSSDDSGGSGGRAKDNAISGDMVPIKSNARFTLLPLPQEVEDTASPSSSPTSSRGGKDSGNNGTNKGIWSVLGY